MNFKEPYRKTKKQLTCQAKMNCQEGNFIKKFTLYKYKFKMIILMI